MPKMLIEIDTDTQAVVPMDLMRRIEDYLSTERVSAGVSLYNDVLGVMMAAATQPEQAQQSDKDRLRFRSACEISGDKHPEYVRGYEAAMDAVCRGQQAGEPVDDVLSDALGNLIHDNYERSQCGSRNREADANLIRAALANRKQPTGLTRPAEPGGE